MAFQRIKLQGIPVFGGGRVRDQYVVAPQTKVTIVAWFAIIKIEDYRRKVAVYGDRPLNIPLLSAPD